MFALPPREQRFDQGATPKELSQERPPHLGADCIYAPGLLATLGRDHTLSPRLLPDIGMISLAVEFGVGQNQQDAPLSSSRFDGGANSHNRFID